ncbi:MAG: hypothetical protein AAGJ34_07325 [Pseudomonadota bacterium]
MELTRLSLSHGVYTGVLTGGREGAALSLFADDTKLTTATVESDHKSKSLFIKLSIPADVIEDGVVVLTIRDETSNEILDTISIVSGRLTEENLASRVASLEAQLDLIKTSIRRLAQK